MPRLENPIPDMMEATDAVAKIISLHTEQFLLNQELKTLKQIKRTLWVGASLIFLNMLLSFAFYWFEIGLHEAGWSPFSLALLSITFFGVFISIFIFRAFNIGTHKKLTRTK